ncbi:hypothetical protein J8H85_18045 [Mariniflexile gromovii]|uniref:Uncharacterized protein n=2 Tax=Mariniflexile gromovii TaxID=362523 RepID=A0ABS4BYS0_9FLAO|nr:hypothetical protein [Mariniflexile gromovii]MBP0905730.1 hypothetical protein [Mariniflexile gromovii]
MDRSYFITIDFKHLSKAEQEEQGCEAIITYGDGNDAKKGHSIPPTAD